MYKKLQFLMWRSLQLIFVPANISSDIPTGKSTLLYQNMREALERKKWTWSLIRRYSNRSSMHVTKNNESGGGVTLNWCPPPNGIRVNLQRVYDTFPQTWSWKKATLAELHCNTLSLQLNIPRLLISFYWPFDMHCIENYILYYPIR